MLSQLPVVPILTPGGQAVAVGCHVLRGHPREDVLVACCQLRSLHLVVSVSASGVNRALILGRYCLLDGSRPSTKHLLKCRPLIAPILYLKWQWLSTCAKVSGTLPQVLHCVEGIGWWLRAWMVRTGWRPWLGQDGSSVAKTGTP